ncbi:manganese-dependent ADP-ribose/CDP-alcohol diphosphatase isoform X2 [Octopus bimaculoides]|uniref:manganese-dependent ADP-ribose/CDP-alcohol diphosphatase isoform X2 n=1 Tax=Octopus bimaculoides TaxID=37653 RepID=UPI00071E15E0|nr:manganese-dependent ADP-ribose/CDP-alcohol diphosphatase isoform X2 [Octopus bimaculoides]|eukprot:XP_014768233.1 PREDICTED: manganese-dependent ADP-ribose/CDP-alcohol diphosphatase-like isoform X2 [Octopus bimaculoides]
MDSENKQETEFNTQECSILYSAKLLPNMVLLSFGIITDIQYADREDGYDFFKINKRHFRASLEQTSKAINYWMQSANEVSFILQLGDLLDGYNKRNNQRDRALACMKKAFSKFPRNVYHVWGNHEFYNFTHEELLNSILNSSLNKACKNIPGRGYYSFTPHKSLKFLILDCYAVNMIDQLCPNYQEAKEMFKVNTNKDINCSDGLDDSTCMVVAYNGAIGKAQMEWISASLQQAEELHQNVVICGHCPVYIKSCNIKSLCWDSAAILKLISSFNCVLAYFAGHEHQGGFAIDPKGIYHITFPGVIETSPDTSCFATVELHPRTLQVCGQGKIQNYSIPLRYEVKT